MKNDMMTFMENRTVEGIAFSAVPSEYQGVAARNVPSVTELSGVDMVDVFSAIGRASGSFFLDSSMKHSRWGRYSFAGCHPLATLRSSGRFNVISSPAGTMAVEGDPFAVLQNMMDFFGFSSVQLPFPFIGGAVGYFGYDLGRWVERIPDRTVADLPFPDLYFGFYTSFFAADHIRKKMYRVCWGKEDREMEKIERTDHCGPARSGGRLVDRSFSHQEYVDAVTRVKDYIAAGDIFQANLSQRFSYTFECSPMDLYLNLRRVNPAPFSCYMNPAPGMSVLSSSPERFVYLDKEAAHTCPIKGTRPRRVEKNKDRCIQQELLASEKDNAELNMIVDLERNDLGRVCRYGSVRVPRKRELHTFATVHHLISTVEGRLRRGIGNCGLVRAMFPGGSITGAPKIRAMEIIEELEPVRRSLYTGSIGYAGFNRVMDLNIAIRTLLTVGHKAYYQVGGGIVADSDPEAEYQETLDKGKALERTLL